MATNWTRWESNKNFIRLFDWTNAEKKLKCPRHDDDERIEKKSLDELVELRCFQ